MLKMRKTLTNQSAKIVEFC